MTDLSDALTLCDKLMDERDDLLAEVARLRDIEAEYHEAHAALGDCTDANDDRTLPLKCVEARAEVERLRATLEMERDYKETYPLAHQYKVERDHHRETLRLVLERLTWPGTIDPADYGEMAEGVMIDREPWLFEEVGDE